MKKNKKLKPLKKIDAFGKNGKAFRISSRRGKYLFISAKDLEMLRRINEEYRLIHRKLIPDSEIVGRGGMTGYKPFLLKGKNGRYVCILEERAKELEKLNDLYRRIIKDSDRDLRKKLKRDE